MGAEINGNEHKIADKAAVSFYKPPSNLDTAETRLKQLIEQKYNVNLADYRALHRWSCDNHAEFWATFADFIGFDYDRVADAQPIDTSKTIAEFPRWFENSKLNYAEKIITNGSIDDVAFINARSLDDIVQYSYKDLRHDVYSLATSLRNFGVKVGDVICGFLPNIYETAVAMYATAAVGATWCSASVDFGPNGVLDRFRQVNPKVLFAVEAVTYKGKRFDLSDKLNQIVSGLPSLEKIILKNNLKTNIDMATYVSGDKWTLWKDFVQPYEEDPANFKFEQVPFNHPLFVMFSSGTTGVPKGIVHTVGGTYLKHAEEHLIQADSRANDRILFYTTCGWMMWNWLMSFTMCGGSIVLYDESPLEPDQHILPKLAAKTKSTMIGMGAKLYDEYTKMDVDFNSLYDLSNLRMVYSTGSPLKPSAFEFINRCLAPGQVIGSISGGTDIIGCFMGCTLSLPVYPGECQCLYLGLDIHAYNENGESVIDEQGELVCIVPFPSMPSHFVNDPDKSKYKKAYFERFDGIWAHGDFCQINKETGGVVMLGRSDATLNRGGVRIGTAEIYSVVETFPEIEDCIVAGQNIPKEEDEHIILFVKMAKESNLTDELKKKLAVAIRNMMSPRHVPNAVYTVPDIPYTNSGKKVEMAVKQIINGYPVQKASSLRNPDSLDCYVQFRLNPN